MPLFSLNGSSGGSGNEWNYAHPENDEFSTQITGTVVEINKVQTLGYPNRTPQFWEDGNPKASCQIVIQGQSGREKTWTFTPNKKGIPFNAVLKALIGYNPNAQSIDDLGGLKICVSTEMPPQGYQFGAGNPRPWSVQILGPGDVPFRGCFDRIKEEQQRSQMAMRQPVQQPQPQQYYQPMQQQQYQQPQQQQYQPQMQQQYQPQPQPHPQQQVDPMLQQAMGQAYGSYQNQQQYPDQGYYSQDVQF